MLNSVHCADLLTLCQQLPDRSIDMILCDLPYGTTQCKWDAIIPFDQMWGQFTRLIKPNRAIVLTGSQPFSSLLIASNLKWFKHEWVWEKTAASGFLNKSHMPLKAHEQILIFASGKTFYYPQMEDCPNGRKYNQPSTTEMRTQVYNKVSRVNAADQDKRYPRSVIRFKRDRPALHPTQKPLALFEYLIKTYTLPGEIVLDPCVGSGTTALAAKRLNRNFIVGDNDLAWVQVTQDRLDIVQPILLG